MLGEAQRQAGWSWVGCGYGGHMHVGLGGGLVRGGRTWAPVPEGGVSVHLTCTCMCQDTWVCRVWWLSYRGVPPDR